MKDDMGFGGGALITACVAWILLIVFTIGPCGRHTIEKRCVRFDTPEQIALCLGVDRKDSR